MFKPNHIDRYRALRERSDRVRAMIHARAVAAYHAAFGSVAGRGAHLDMCIIHNSLIAAEEGKPWREVDYSQMRLAAHLCERSFEPGRIVDRWYLRIGQGA